MKNQVFLFLFLFFATMTWAQTDFEKDVYETQGGELALSFIGHGTLMFEYNDLVIHIDPVSRYADYAAMPKADLILVTHQHGDHLDWNAIEKIRKPETQVVMTEVCVQNMENAGEVITMKNGDKKTITDIEIEAVAAYNIEHKRSNGKAFHPKGEGNGYVLKFSDTKVYVAGDTENIPEMKKLKGIRIAFLPMNLPYTMTPEMVADAARMFRPKILYPYHFGKTDTSKIVALLKNKKGIEVKIRNLK